MIWAIGNYDTAIGGGLAPKGVGLDGAQNSGWSGNITISGGEVHASSLRGYGIGAGGPYFDTAKCYEDDANAIGNAGKILITGTAKVEATGRMAGIGADNGTLIIEGSDVTVGGRPGYEGMGIHFFSKDAKVTISGGTVYANGVGDYCPGISTQYGTVSITGGKVYAHSEKCAGIGVTDDDYDSDSIDSHTKVTISGKDTFVQAKSDKAAGFSAKNWEDATWSFDQATIEVISGGKLSNTVSVFYEGSMVKAGASESSASYLDYKERETAYKTYKYWKIEPCTHERDDYGKCARCGDQQFPIQYVARSWDSSVVSERTEETPTSAVAFPRENNTTLPGGWYYVNENITLDKRLELQGDTRLILGDGYTLNVNGLYIPEGKTLKIYAQSDGAKAGKLISKATGGGSGIGGYSGHNNGNIEIHGGVITAAGDNHCAGIGSNDGKTTGRITIYGGTVNATGGSNSAGIGGGRYSDAGSIAIYDGTVTATGKDDAAGIGGGDGGEGQGNASEIKICGGTVTATASGRGAAIGGGDYGTAKVAITGGKVKATAASGTGIGGGSKLTSDSSAITLGYTDTSKETISVTASSFSGTVTLEKDFSNKSGIYSARSAADLAKLAGSALRAWDDTMETWAALSQTIDGVESGTTIVLDQDYTALPTDSALEVRGKTLTIDLNGFTLDRGLTDSAAKTKGYVLSVAEGATLILKDSDGSGAITGGNTQGDGGGIVNKGTLTLENVTVTGNKCTASGGGIRNYGTGTLTINSGAITDNTAAEYSGGGIYNGGTLNLNGGAITGNFAVGTDSQGGGILQTGTMNVSGAPVVSGNACPNGNNIYLRGDHPTMTVTGKLTDGASLYVTKASDGTGPATSGYASFNTTHPDAYFHTDNPNYGMMQVGGEAYVGQALRGIEYDAYSWSNGELSKTTNTTDGRWMAWPGSGTDVPSGMYVVRDSVTVNGRVMLGGDTSILLCDGCELNVKGLFIPKGKTLTIYGQSGSTGKLISKPSSGAGIGGYSKHDCGSIAIHGGTIEATGYNNCAGIGSNSGQTLADPIYIYNGNITATGGTNGAGIGGGKDASGRRIQIYGGNITAKAVKNGAGIGGGQNGGGGTILILGGNITAEGADSAAGIGGGDPDDSSATNGVIMIYGGTVNATAHSKGAGIGGGEHGHGSVTISGGTVIATGGNTGGAGIGSGKDGDASTITITGGNVMAKVTSTDAVGMGDIEKTSAMTFSYTDETKDGIRITSPSYGGTVTLESDFIDEKGGEVFTPDTYTDAAELADKELVSFARADVPYVDLEEKVQTEACIPVTTGTKVWNRSWYALTKDVHIPEEITVKGTVDLILVDGCTLGTTNIKVAEGNTLRIWGQTAGTGKIVADARDSASPRETAGIGGSNCDGGTIIINGGTVEATGGSGTHEKDSVPVGSAGIGGAYHMKPGEVVINRGTVTATGGDLSSAIGAGSMHRLKDKTLRGRVEINGGTVTAVAQKGGCGIGGGIFLSGGSSLDMDVWINGGKVHATGSEYAEEISGSAIGGGYSYPRGTVHITGGEVTAIAQGHGAAIGAGNYWQWDGTVYISGGVVTAIADDKGGAAIGGGSGATSGSGSVRITGGHINATGDIGSYGGHVILRWEEEQYGHMYVDASGSYRGYVDLERSFVDEKTGETLRYADNVVYKNKYNMSQRKLVPAGFEVSFWDGWDLLFAQYLKPGEKATRPDDQVKEGQDFYGWYVYPDDNSKFDFNTPVHDDIVLDGQWYTKPQFTGLGLVLKGQIGVLFNVELPYGAHNYDDVYMIFTVNGKEQKVPIEKAIKTDSYGVYWSFPCYINSIQMADQIKAELHYDVKWSISTQASAAYYIKYIQENSDKFDDKVLALANALADYGHYAQEYLSPLRGWTLGPVEDGKDHEIMPLAAGLTDAQIADIKGKVGNFGISRDPGNSGIEKVTFSLDLDSETRINLYLYPKEDFSGDVSCTVNGEAVEAKLSDGKYWLVIPNIAAHKLGEEYTVNVKTAKGSFDIVVSVLSYVKTALENPNSKDKWSTVAALYNFYDAASAAVQGAA